MPPDAPAAVAATTPAPAAATPSAAAPAATGTPAPPASGAPGAAAAPTSIVGDAKGEGAPAAPATPPAPTKDEQLAFLTTKGVKPEEAAKLDEAGLKAKFDELKGADDRTAALAKMEIKVPEGAVIDEKVLGAFKELAVDAKVPPETAQKFVDMHAAAVKEATEGPVRLWMDTQKQWQEKVSADPELGGKNLPLVTSTIAKFLDGIGGKEAPAMRKAFIFTGAGNNPEIVRLMYRAAKHFAEATAQVTGSPTGGAKPDVQAQLQKLYPSSSDAQAARTT